MSICANPACGKEFEQKSKYREAKTCSKECRYAVSAATTKSSSGRWETKTCPCGVEFQSAKAKPQTYHDWDCMMKHRQEDSRASRTCENPECGKEFTYFKRQDQRTCSPACRNKVTAMQRENNYPECRTCGVSTGSYNRIYCDEHRPNRPGRKPLPRKTAVCQNPDCGQEFSKPGTWPGAMMFCSLDCSNKAPSYRRIKRYSFGNLNAEGGYELRFLACLQRLNIEWEPWPDDAPIRYTTPDGKARTYTPDFRVEDLVVEVKGQDELNENQAYARSHWSLPEPLIIVDRERLGRLEKMFNRQQFLDALSFMT